MELENKQQINTYTYKELTSNKEILEEIKTLLTQEENNNSECISLYYLSSLLKQTWKKEYYLIEEYEEEFDYVLKKERGHSSYINIGSFDYSKNELEIAFWTSRDSYKIIFSKRDGDLYIASSSDEQYAQEILVLLGHRISALFDELQKHKEFNHIGWHYLKSINSNFKICLNALDINIYSEYHKDNKTKRILFELSTWHNDHEYKYKCNSNNIINEIRGNENELFKRIFIKIEDCPDWTKPILYEKRKNQLEEQQRIEEEKQKQEEKRQKILALKRKFLPFLK